MKYPWEELLNERGYLIRETLGEGAFSKVKLAYSVELKRDVAIKCISFEKAPKEFTANFLPRELKILPKLRHENIVQVFEIYQNYNEATPQNSFVCIVMEYARHGDMLKYIQRKGALSESDVRKYFWQLCQAISYCHAKYFCHRDLKCENLLLGRNRTLLLTDFGFCKQVTFDYRGNVNLSETFCGSAAYAAPETLQGKPYNPFMNDMWSLGVILYIISCGEMPFDDSNVPKMIKMQLRNQIKFPSSLRSRLSSKLKSLIRLLLEVDVSSRGTIDDVLSHPFFQNRDDLKSVSNEHFIPSKFCLEERRVHSSASNKEKNSQFHKKSPALKHTSSRFGILQNKHMWKFSKSSTNAKPRSSSCKYRDETESTSCPHCGFKNVVF